VPESGGFGATTPASFDYVVATGASSEAPFTDLRKLRGVSGVELYAVDAGSEGGSTAPDCGALALPAG